MRAYLEVIGQFRSISHTLADNIDIEDGDEQHSMDSDGKTRVKSVEVKKGVISTRNILSFDKYRLELNIPYTKNEEVYLYF